MKLSRNFLVSILTIVCSSFFTQTNSSIWFKRGKGNLGCTYKLSIANQPEITMNPNDLIKFTMYSIGNVKISLIVIPPCHVYGYEEVFIAVEPGNNYYIDVNVANNKQVMSLNKDISETYDWGTEITKEVVENEKMPINSSYFSNSAAPREELPSSGTGFLVSNNGYILTNQHVIHNAINVKVQNIGMEQQKQYRAKVIATDEDNDLAILKLDLDDPSEIKFDSLPYTFRFSGFETGEDVFVLGYPLISSMGEEIKLTKGIISSKSGYQGNTNSCQISAAVQPGNSGSPVFDASGNIIGVINSKIMNAEGVSYAIKPSFIESLFKNNDINFVPSKKSKTEKLTLAQQTKIITPFVYIIIAER